MAEEKAKVAATPPTKPPPPKAGLEGMVAGDSSICFIDGQKGILRYRGYDVTDLAVSSTFEEVVYLLWRGDLPKQAELTSFRAELASAIALPTAVVEAMRVLPKSLHPMTALRTLVSVAGNADPDAECDPMDVVANLRKATRLLGQTSAICAAWDRNRKGQAPIAPNPKLGFAANFLLMLSGETPSETSTRVFDECLVLHADHEFNASTFTARVIAATLADMHSSVVGALGALKGPLHGGANTAVMQMLLEIDGQGGAPAAAAWITDALAKKRKIMGFGHRVYKTDDPRATRLKKLSEMLAKERGPEQGRWFTLSNEFATSLQAQKSLPANVDFFSASTYYMLGIAPDMFTPIFALSRTSGWTAHVLEQYANNRLIRPLSNYVGPGARPYPPLGSR